MATLDGEIERDTLKVNIQPQNHQDKEYDAAIFVNNTIQIADNFLPSRA